MMDTLPTEIWLTDTFPTDTWATYAWPTVTMKHNYVKIFVFYFKLLKLYFKGRQVSIYLD